MALSTTIIRFSPTPPIEPDELNLDSLGLPKSLDQVQPQHSKSLDPLPAQQCKSPEPSRSGSALSCTRSQSECNYHCPTNRTGDISAGLRDHKHLSESNARQLTKVDSGYCSNLNIQQTSSSAGPQNSQQWGTASSVSSCVFAGGLNVPSSYSSDGLHYVPIPSLKPQCPGMINLPNQEDMQSLLSGHPLFNPPLNQQYLRPEAPLHPSVYHMGTTGNGVYSVSSTGMFSFFAVIYLHNYTGWNFIMVTTNILLLLPFVSPGIPNSGLTVRHIHHTSGPLGITGTAGSHHLPRPPNPEEMGMMGKPYNQYGAEQLVATGVDELRGKISEICFCEQIKSVWKDGSIFI